MPWNHKAGQKRAARMIKRWGGTCQLVRNGVSRDCVAGRLENNPRASGLELEGAARYLIAAPLDTPPDHELDRFVSGTESFRIVAPVKGPKPNGVMMFYDITVVYDGTA